MILALALQLSLNESQIQACACEGMQQEVRTAAGTYVDCLDDEYAIEIEATSGWAEALGQSLHYAEQTGRKAKVLFFCEEEPAVCQRHQYRFEATVAAYGLPIEWEYVADRCVGR